MHTMCDKSHKIGDIMISLCIYDSVKRAFIHKDGAVWVTFDELVDLFRDNQKEVINKEDGMLFNCVSYIDDYEPPEIEKFNWLKNRTDHISRCKDNVDKIYCLLLDVDGKQTLEQTIEQWHPYEFLIYSTWGNSCTKDKFRLIVPLYEPLTNIQFDSRTKAMKSMFNLVDGASFTISQCFYLPTYAPGNKDIAFIHHNKSELKFDAMVLPVEQISTNTATIIPKDYIDPLSKIIYETLLTGSGLRYADVLSLAVLCKSKGIDQIGFSNIVNTIADADSSLRTNQVNLTKLYKEGYDCFMTNRKAVELMRKLNCNMWMFKNNIFDTQVILIK
jgi:hypothetical protein